MPLEEPVTRIFPQIPTKILTQVLTAGRGGRADFSASSHASSHASLHHAGTMEIFTIFSNREDIAELFVSYLKASPLVSERAVDQDTIYFSKKGGDRNEMYVHFVLNDIDHDLDINYSPAEKDQILSFFKDEQFYAFDISVRDKEFWKKIEAGFILFLQTIFRDDARMKLLISDPFGGLFKYEFT